MFLVSLWRKSLKNVHEKDNNTTIIIVIIIIIIINHHRHQAKSTKQLKQRNEEKKKKYCLHTSVRSLEFCLNDPLMQVFFFLLPLHIQFIQRMYVCSVLHITVLTTFQNFNRILSTELTLSFSL